MHKFPVRKRLAGAMALAGTSMACGAVALHFLWPAPAAEAAASVPIAHSNGQIVAQPVAAANTVAIHNLSFGPTTLTVPSGTKVVWTNQDNIPHTVTSETDPKELKSPPLQAGSTFSFIFDKPGTYRYFCSIHPHMHGTIAVQ